MKKTFKIILINIALFIVCILVLDVILWKTSPQVERPFFFAKNEKQKKDFYISQPAPYSYRPTENIDSNKKPIVLFGCSYTEGVNLGEKETFSYWLGKLTNRPIYNRAQAGWSPKEMLYQLSNSEFYNVVPEDKNNKPEFVIFVLIEDHLNRINQIRSISYPISYKLNKKRASNEKFLLRNRLEELLSFTSLYPTLKQSLYNGNKKEELTLIKYYFLDAYYEIKKNYGPSTKFIVFIYENNEKKEFINNIKTLEKEGIKVLSLDDLSNKNFITLEYQLNKDDVHPNAKAWREITPLVVKKLKLNK